MKYVVCAAPVLPARCGHWTVASLPRGGQGDSHPGWSMLESLSAVAGALISFAVVVRGMRRQSAENRLLQRLVDAATNRDFSVQVFGLACLEQLELFLWMSAIGSHVFWLTALTLQRENRFSRRLPS